MRFQLASFLVVGLLMTVSAVPELEHDMTEVDMRDCKIFTKLSCIRECPKGYVGVFRAMCSAAEDAHECCAVRCCRSMHTDDDGDEFETARNPYTQSAPQAASGSRYVARSRSGFRPQ